TGQDCVYDAIPGVAPGVLAPASLLIDTPAAPGFYDLRWTRDLQFNCAGALANFPNQPLTTFGRIRVGDPNRFETVVKNVNINGQGNRATVAAGEDFQVTLDYALWNDDACPSCRSQIVIGLNDQGLDCAYDSVPGATPGFTGSATLDLEALPTGGTQMLRWARSLELNCADAIAKFSSDTSTPIGEIEAGAALPEIFADGFENRCLNFTALAQPDPIPSSFNPATDPVSIYFANTTSGTGAELNDRARAYLNVVAAGLSNAPAAAYNLEGNTAECGTNESNLALGQARSNAVREFLISQGVGENQLRAVSFGEERPFCVESNVDCWRTNSRVRFVLTSPP
ncbi:MAG: OmpA family protein, partial [Pseudomonadota bacterium]